MFDYIIYSDLIFFIFNYLLLFFLEKKFSVTKWKTKPGFADRWNNRSKPTLGGVGFMGALLAAFFVAQVVLGESFHWSLLAAGVVAFGVGFVDDLHGLSPIPKFAGQLVAASLLMLGTESIPLLENETINKLITLIWIVGIMNSFNMLDNMDAVATVPALGLVLLFMLQCIVLQLPETDFVLFLFMTSALTAFLFFNGPPSKIFMGDSGSMIMGLLLAYGGLKCGWLTSSSIHEVGFWPRAGLVAMLFFIPLTDTALVVFQRLRHGISPARGGRDHSTHNLFYMGLSEKMIPVLFGVLVAMQIVLFYFTAIHTAWMENMALPQPILFGRVLHKVQVPNPVYGMVFFSLYFIFIFTISFINLRRKKYAYTK